MQFFILNCCLILLYCMQFYALSLGNDDSLNTCIFISPDGTEQQRLFDRRRQICCLKSGVWNRYDDRQLVSCCGANTYKKSQDRVCCGNKVHDGFDAEGRRLHCCGETLFPETVESKFDICCGNDIIKRKSRDSLLRCCNGLPYNNTEKYCYSNRKVLLRGQRLCQSDVYNTETHICCGKTLYVRSKGDHCCGPKLYNSSTDQCCIGNHIQPKNKRCCGKGHYDIANQICCQQEVFDKLSLDTACCGNQTYNSRTQGCCMGQIFNKIKWKCCGDQVVGQDVGCCGKMSFDIKFEVCCRHEDRNQYSIVRKSNPSHDACCTKGLNPVSYNTATEECKASSTNQCLMNGPFNFQKDLCCNGEIEEGGRERGKECCYPGTKSYYRDREICCHGQVKARTKKGCDNNERSVTVPKTTTVTYVTMKTPSQQISRPTATSIVSVNGGDSYSICKICMWKQEHIKEAIIQKEMNVCKRNAILVYVVSTRNFRQRRAAIHWTILKVRSVKNLYNPNQRDVTGIEFKLYIPCSCQKFYMGKKKKRFIFITNIRLQKKSIVLGDSDVFLPVFKGISGVIRKTEEKCDFNLVNKLRSVLRNF